MVQQTDSRPVKVGPEFSDYVFANPRHLGRQAPDPVSGAYLPTAVTFPYYDVSPDGQRFLMIMASEQTSSLTQIVVVQKRFEELKRRVPTGTK